MNLSIVLTAFGTARPEGLSTFETIRKRVNEKYPNATVQWAFTSGFLRRKLAEQGIDMPSAREAVVRAVEEGDTVVVQPFQIVPGGEFDGMVSELAEHDAKIQISSPLLSTEEEIPHVISTVIEVCRSRNTPFILAGHGNGDHHSDSLFVAIDTYLQENYLTARCATLDAHPTIEEILCFYEEKGISDVEIIPFLFAAGKHVRSDIGGEKQGSWKRRFQDRGIQCDVVLRGLGDYESLVSLWLEHLNVAVDSLI